MLKERKCKMSSYQAFCFNLMNKLLKKNGSYNSLRIIGI